MPAMAERGCCVSANRGFFSDFAEPSTLTAFEGDARVVDSRVGEFDFLKRRCRIVRAAQGAASMGERRASAAG